MLTKQQQKLLSFIKDFQQGTGVSPSYDEMRLALNQKSKSSVHMLLMGLVERGFIRKLSNRARALEILKYPDMGTPTLIASESSSEQGPILVKEEKKEEASSIGLPFYGVQGTVFPIKSFLSDPEKMISIPKDLISKSSNASYCAIQMSGDALKEMSILDGDILFFKMTHKAEAGKIVLASVDNENIHVKKWEEKDGKIVLSLSNKYMMPQAYGPERVSIKGVMVLLTRKAL